METVKDTAANKPRITVFKARWVCPVTSPPIENGAVAVAGSKILACGPAAAVPETVWGSSPKVVELGDGAIIPGLINAHTHLEFSGLEKPLGHSGIEFTQWIREVVSQRNHSANKPLSIKQRIG